MPGSESPRVEARQVTCPRDGARADILVESFQVSEGVEMVVVGCSRFLNGRLACERPCFPPPPPGLPRELLDDWNPLGW